MSRIGAVDGETTRLHDFLLLFFFAVDYIRKKENGNLPGGCCAVPICRTQEAPPEEPTAKAISGWVSPQPIIFAVAVPDVAVGVDATYIPIPGCLCPHFFFVMVG